MNRTQAACYSLIASMFILAGLLLVNVSGSLTPSAHADMVIGNRINIEAVFKHLFSHWFGLCIFVRCKN